MNEHVVGSIADYLEGRLPLEEAQAFLAHTRTCEECAGELAFAERMVKSSWEQGLAHLRPDRLVSMAEDIASCDEDERAHLESCMACRTELDWVIDNAQAVPPTTSLFTTEVGRGPAEPLAWYKSWWMWGPALAAGVALILIVTSQGPNGIVRMTTLAHFEPLPVLIPRSTPEPGSYEAVRINALESYQQGDYSAAITSLQRASVMRPGNAEDALVLGSALALSGQPVRAVAVLETAVKAGRNRREALWILANAQLVSGDVDAATATLDTIIDAQGVHARAAADLLGRMQ